MPGMKVTVSAAMRARDVSRPQPHHEAAAEQNSSPARPRTRRAPRSAGNNGSGQAAPVAPPAPRHRPAPPGPRPDGATPPDRAKDPRPAARPPRLPAAPAREPGQREAAPGRETPAPRRPGEPRDARGSVTAKNSERPAGDAGSEPAARGRPAKRKRVRRRRSHGR
jgi:hypothetical protein